MISILRLVVLQTRPKLRTMGRVLFLSFVLVAYPVALFKTLRADLALCVWFVSLIIARLALGLGLPWHFWPSLVAVLVLIFLFSLL